MQLLRTVSLALFAVVASPAQGQPANDECTGALPIGNGTYTSLDNFTATTSSPAWPCGAGANDVWFVYIVGAPGTLTVNTCGSGLDTVLQVFDGAVGCGALVSVGCNDDSFCAPGSTVTATVTPGPYYIRVGGFAGGIPSYGVFSLTANGPAGIGSIATNTLLGAGCGGGLASPYETFDHWSFDLNGRTLMWSPTATGYVVSANQAGIFVPPTPAATVVASGQNGQQLFALPAPMPVPGGSVAVINVTTVGLVELGAAAAAGLDTTPTANELLDWPTPVFACWSAFDPTLFSSGAITFEVIAGTAYATWNGVRHAQSHSPDPVNTFQFQFDLATGAVRLVIVNVWIGSNVGYPVDPLCVVGSSPPGPSVDPGALDLSTSLQIPLVLSVDRPRLQLQGISRPRLGTSWQLAVSAIPPTAALGIDVFGTTDPGLDDLGPLGMPGCGLRSSLEVMLAWPVGGATHGYSLPIPNVPSLVGQRFFTTSAVLTNPPLNAFGAITSNGIEALLGSV